MNKGVAPIMIIILLAVGVIGALAFTGNLGNLATFQATSPLDTSDFDQSADCDQDGLTRIVASYLDELADDSASLAVDAELYELQEDGNWLLVSTTNDETSATFGTYNEVGTNIGICGKQYELFLGDETEEYFRTSGPFLATGSEKRVTVSGSVIGSVTWSGSEAGTTESPVNLTLGSGASTGDLTIKFTSSDADQSIDAPDGLILTVSYNDTAWAEVTPTGIKNVNGLVEQNGQPIREVTCPEVVGRSILNGNGDNVEQCWLLPVTYVADNGAFEIATFIGLESGVNPDSGTTCDGEAVTGCGILVSMLDQNMFQNTEAPNTPMELGYQADDEDDIGKTSLGTQQIRFA